MLSIQGTLSTRILINHFQMGTRGTQTQQRAVTRETLVVKRLLIIQLSGHRPYALATVSPKAN